MTRAAFLAPLGILTRRRDPAATRRELLDVDAGALLVPSVYPYPAGARPVRAFVSRVVNPGRGPRPLGHLYPPTGNPSQRVHAHIDYAGRAQGDRMATRDASGIRQPAKGARVRPWLFAGGSSATPADKLAAGVASRSSTPCEDC